jgi:hypothetical protein
VLPTTPHPQLRFELSTCHHSTHLEFARVSHDHAPRVCETCSRSVSIPVGVVAGCKRCLLQSTLITTGALIAYAVCSTMSFIQPAIMPRVPSLALNTPCCSPEHLWAGLEAPGAVPKHHNLSLAHVALACFGRIISCKWLPVTGPVGPRLGSPEHRQI